jgi:hypothetical protein
MATLEMFGPYSWATITGENWLMPGDAHPWALDFGMFFHVASVSAHPSQAMIVQALAVEGLSTAYGRTDLPAVNFRVRNVSNTAVRGYRVFVSVMTLS